MEFMQNKYYTFILAWQFTTLGFLSMMLFRVPSAFIFFPNTST